MTGAICGVDWGGALRAAESEPGVDVAVFRRLLAEAEGGFVEGAIERQRSETDG